ncbi:MAG: hypothetical protein Q8Q09_15695 [Deltaproteobacteria bacterium]|nr:hypothetical protein [Deltaproteobacteria bacterium]
MRPNLSARRFATRSITSLSWLAIVSCSGGSQHVMTPNATVGAPGDSARSGALAANSGGEQGPATLPEVFREPASSTGSVRTESQDVDDSRRGFDRSRSAPSVDTATAEPSPSARAPQPVAQMQAPPAPPPGRAATTRRPSSVATGSSTTPTSASTDGVALGGAIAQEESASNRAQNAPVNGQNQTRDEVPRQRSWQQATARNNALRLSVGDRDSLPLRGLQVRAQVDGFRARVVMDAYFLNDRGRQLEGTFQLRLPEGASPYFFAFGSSAYRTQDAQQASIPFFAAPSAQGLGVSPDEILRQRATAWNDPRQARIVPRERAAHAYTETVRARVDPALMEWSGAGVFEARVFPLETEKLHRIVVAYDVTLTRDGEDLVLPMDLPADVRDVILDVAVAQHSNNAISLTPRVPTRNDGGYVLARLDRPQERRTMVRIRGASPTLVGSDGGPEAYFSTQVSPVIPVGENMNTAGSAVFMVDTSLSGQPENFRRWAQILQRVLDTNRDSIRSFAVQFFDVAPRWWNRSFVENTPANVAALLRTVNERSLQGATDLGAALQEAARPSFATPPSQRWDTFLLSDAAVTWGEADITRIAQGFSSANRGRLFAYRVATTGGGDGSVMAQLVRPSGGAVFTIANDQDLDRAATAHRASPWRLRSASIAGASDLLIDGAPTHLFPGQMLTVVGRGRPTAGAPLQLEIERGGQRMQVQVALGATLSSSLAPRAYGEVAVQRLEERAPLVEREAKAFATHFRVTGRTCSLVMLESEADYQRFGIVPADDLRVVNATSVRALEAQSESATQQLLGDARGNFLLWLDRLGSTPGATVRITRAVRDSLAQLPVSAFEIPAERLSIQHDRASEMTATLRTQLEQPELGYDEISAEAERLRGQQQNADALRTLSSLVERRPGDTELARDVAFSASSWGMPVSAYHLLRRVQSLRPAEPQTYRLLAETLASMGRNELAMAMYDIAMASEWGPRSRDFQTISGVGYLHFLREIARGTRRTTLTSVAAERLRELTPQVTPARADILVMIAWSTDNTDIDLHVVDPNGEECYYGHRNTRIGGFLTQDITTGYGPEMFVQPNASPGNYRVFAHFFGSNRNRTSARTRVLATVVRRWGSANEEVTTRAITLGNGGERQDIEQINWSQ